MKQFEDVWRSLNAARTPVALAVGSLASEFVTNFARWRGVSVAAIGHVLSVRDTEGWKHPARLCREDIFLSDLEILFWPDVAVDPLRLLRGLSRHHPVVAIWPGEIAGGRATFSEPGRRDYYDEPLVGEVVVRTRPISIPTDVPYDLEITR